MKKIPALLFIILMFLSCQDRKDNKWLIDLPESRINLKSEMWGVTLYSSLKLREEKGRDSGVITYLKNGVILKILIKDMQISEFENMLDYWYFVDYRGEKGWLFGSYILLYNTLEEAEKACRERFYE